MRRPLILGAAVLLVLATPPVGAQVGPIVEINGGAFVPQVASADPGQTVTFVVREAGHTITEDSCATQGGACLFRFPAGGATAPANSTYTFQAPDDDVTVGYYCEVHGRPTTVGFPGRCSMCGQTVVGAGSPSPPPTPTPPPLPEIHVGPTRTHTTIAAGLEAASEGTRVLVDPGTYRENVVITTPDVQLVGLSSPTGEGVLIQATISGGTGLIVGASGVRLENLTVRGFTSNGVLLSATDFEVSGVTAVNNLPSGFLVSGGRRGRIADSVARNSSGAGFSVRDCLDCDVLLEGNTAEANPGAGYLAVNAGGVVLRDNTMTGNGTGIVLRSDLLGTGPPQRGHHVFRNEVSSSVTDGIRVSGGWFDRVEDNVVSGSGRFGLLLTGVDGPVVSGRVLGNVLIGSGRADLAWDGLAVATCFEGNEGDEDYTTDPSFLEAFWSCGSALPVGLPNPGVLV